jgi:hypothetical protein
LRQGPNIAGSVEGASPISGDADLPKVTRPAARYRATIVASCGATKSANSLLEPVDRVPVSNVPRSFSRNGAPASGPAASGAVAVCRPRS